MIAAESTIPQSIGALRSSIKLTLHTYHALRLWHGRKAAENIVPIIGLNSYLLLTNQMIRGAAQDDPYSDFWMLRIERKIDDVKSRLAALKEQIDGVFEAVSHGLSLGENLNLEPASLAVFASSPLGFLGIYLLADYDDIARKILLARHVALIDNPLAIRWLDEESAHHLRSLFTLVQRYRYAGITRDDYVANNAPARVAKEKYGELPQEIVEATLRSRYAPSIARYEKNRTPVTQTESFASEADPTIKAGEVLSDLSATVLTQSLVTEDVLHHEAGAVIDSTDLQSESPKEQEVEPEDTQAEPPKTIEVKKSVKKSSGKSTNKSSEVDAEITQETDAEVNVREDAQSNEISE